MIKKFVILLFAFMMVFFLNGCIKVGIELGEHGGFQQPAPQINPYGYYPPSSGYYPQ